ncbi:MAG: tRNA preQ1(34) S-adenosylmethionine ribosyltransferase-isomerase QueA [Bacteroidales bacterium]|jgi:S-adenosylmethionine:tRNA ribosyltransferase-isomerase|nr:tRNA preQ1(34) S-adenosylmethionine ribosyltransferase-isomerase QueA [Bacteroidales bacterium]
MKLSQFKFNLPKELIASKPAENRDDSRLMVLDRAKKTIEHKMFVDILGYYGEGDLLVLNNTKVFPARLWAEKEKTGAKIEVFLLRELNPECNLWDALVDPARKIRIGNKLYFGDDQLVAEVIDNTTNRGRTLRFLYDGPPDEFRKLLHELGEAPIPKVHERPADEMDAERYQTIYAKHEGAVAAPTAGLHFSRILMKKMELQGVNFSEVTLHVGLGNFRHIEVEDLSKYKMDSEELIISETTADVVNKTKENGKKVCAVGTTVMKGLESSVAVAGYLKPFKGWTNAFIYPPYPFHIADSMITNFHLPQSSMMMLTAAFADYDFLLEAYDVAVREKYRFFTYGDAMLII